jgi:hypothetical protein
MRDSISAMPSEVGFSVVTWGSSPISRNARPGFSERPDKVLLGIDPPRDLHETAQAFARHQHQIVARPFDETADPGLDRRGIRRVVDGEHRTLQHIRPLFRQQAGKLRLLAGFQDKNAIAVQSVSHDFTLTPIACYWLIMAL